MAVFYLEVICVIVYAAASARGAYEVLRRREGGARPGKALFFAAVALHSAVIGIESTLTSGTLLSGPNIIMLASWVLAVVTAIGLLATKRGLGFAVVAGPVAALLIVASQWLKILDPTCADNLAYYEWPLLVPHIVLVFVALACFAVVATASGMQLYQRRLMTRRSARVFTLDTPSLDTQARIARLAALVGLIVFAGAMLVGFTHMVALYAAMSSVHCEGSLAYLTPRVVLSLVVAAVWGVYVVVSFLAPLAMGSKARAFTAIGGFVLMLALIAVSAG